MEARRTLNFFPGRTIQNIAARPDQSFGCWRGAQHPPPQALPERRLFQARKTKKLTAPATAAETRI